MSKIKPFLAYRPIPEKARSIASLPYDVVNTEEARKLAEKSQYSFLKVIKPEIHFPAGHDPYDPVVYQKGKEMFRNWVEEGIFFQESEESFYVYQLIMDGRVQTGLVGLASIDDYDKGVIKIHELTRPDKEEDRKQHIRLLNMQAEPVFFSYPAVIEIDQLINTLISYPPLYEFMADDGIKHIVWKVNDKGVIDKLTELFQTKVPATYVADGHHRTAAAAAVGKERSAQQGINGNSSAYEYFLAVHFPDNQLEILDYNRVIQELNGLNTNEFLEALSPHFDIHLHRQSTFQPSQPHHFGLYMEGQWYQLIAKTHTYNPDDPIKVLDVNVLTEYVLSPILGITDLRRDKRIDFVGGIRGMEALQKRVDSGEMKAAFALYPVSMSQLKAIADQELIMPPKTTWFEPKLRSGLFIHAFEEIE